jgi:hypothetical protein
LPEPLTAPGAAQACPACLPSPSNQRTSVTTNARSARLKEAPAARPCLFQTGGFTCLDLSTGVLGNTFRASLKHPSRPAGFSHLRGRFTRSKRPSGLHFSPEKCGGGPLALIFPPVLRVSGTLRRSRRISNSLTNNPDKAHGPQT